MTNGGTSCSPACNVAVTCGTEADCPPNEECKVVTTAVDLGTGRHVQRPLP